MTQLQIATVENEVAVRTLIRQAILDTPEYSLEVSLSELEFNSADSFEQKIQDGLCIIAVDERGEVCGTCIGEDEGGVIWLSWIAVMPEYQRRGIAQQLLDKFIDVVRGEGIRRPLGHKITCSALMTNTASNSLFTKFGFHKNAELYDHWHRLDFNLWSFEV